MQTTEQVSEFIQMATTAISGLHFSMHIAQDRHRLQCVQLHAEALRCCSEVLQFTDQAIAFNTTTSKATVTATMSGVDSTTSTGLMECNDLDVSTAKPSSSSSLSSSIMNDVETSFKCVARDAVKLIRTHAYLISRFTEPRFVIHSRGEKLSLCSAGVSASAHSSTHAGADTGASAPSSSHIYSLSYPQSHSYHAVLGAVGIVNSLGNILILQGKEKERDAEGKQETLTGGTESSSEYRQELLFLKNSCTEAVKSTPVYVRLPSTGIKGSVAVGAVLSSRPAAAVVDMDSSCICSDGLSLAWMLPQMQTAVTDSGPQVLRLCILSSVIAERATYSREGSNNNDGVTRGYSGSASTVEIEKTEGMLCDHALLANIARLTIQYTL